MMTLVFRTDSSIHILLDGEDTGLGVLQHASGTIVYRRGASRADHCEVSMPRIRYSFHQNIDTEVFEQDIRAHLALPPTERTQS